jgi:hypothetical protein
LDLNKKMKHLKEKLQLIRGAAISGTFSNDAASAVVDYARYCRELASRFALVGESLRAGAEMQALLTAGENPPLMEIVRALTPDEQAACQLFCLNRGIDPPPPWPEDVVTALDQAEKRGLSPAHALSRSYRSAMLKQDERQALRLLRVIARLNPADTDAVHEIGRIESKFPQEAEVQFRASHVGGVASSPVHPEPRMAAAVGLSPSPTPSARPVVPRISGRPAVPPVTAADSAGSGSMTAVGVADHATVEISSQPISSRAEPAARRPAARGPAARGPSAGPIAETAAPAKVSKRAVVALVSVLVLLALVGFFVLSSQAQSKRLRQNQIAVVALQKEVDVLFGKFASLEETKSWLEEQALTPSVGRPLIDEHRTFLQRLQKSLNQPEEFIGFTSPDQARPDLRRFLAVVVSWHEACRRPGIPVVWAPLGMEDFQPFYEWSDIEAGCWEAVTAYFSSPPQRPNSIEQRRTEQIERLRTVALSLLEGSVKPQGTSESWLPLFGQLKMPPPIWLPLWEDWEKSKVTDPIELRKKLGTLRSAPPWLRATASDALSRQLLTQPNVASRAGPATAGSETSQFDPDSGLSAHPVYLWILPTEDTTAALAAIVDLLPIQSEMALSVGAVNDPWNELKPWPKQESIAGQSVLAYGAGREADPLECLLFDRGKLVRLPATSIGRGFRVVGEAADRTILFDLRIHTSASLSGLLSIHKKLFFEATINPVSQRALVKTNLLDRLKMNEPAAGRSFHLKKLAGGIERTFEVRRSATGEWEILQDRGNALKLADQQAEVRRLELEVTQDEKSLGAENQPQATADLSAVYLDGLKQKIAKSKASLVAARASIAPLQAAALDSAIYVLWSSRTSGQSTPQKICQIELRVVPGTGTSGVSTK